MEQETKICQNCKASFTIDAQDFAFYEKIKVPAPTWCPECRMMRRFLWRNERSLYKRKCNATGKDIISMFSPDKPIIVYDHDYWWSDKWDQLASGREYDFSRPFFVQFKELLESAPLPNLANSNVVNSEYGNHNADCKNCYLTYASFVSENVSYSNGAIESKDSFDLDICGGNENSYENLLCAKSYNSSFSHDCGDILNSAFLYSCRNLSDCFGCVNLRSKSFHIFNKPYSKEDYKIELEKIDLGSYKNLLEYKNKFKEFSILFPKRFASLTKCTRVTGSNVMKAKNCLFCFDGYGNVEDSKFIIHAVDSKDSYDGYGCGGGAELLYEVIDSGVRGSRNKFTIFTHSCHSVSFTYACHSSSNLFGCVGLKSKEYCIFNKQYTKEEYEKLVPKIIQHINNMPYIDKKGHIYKYGEFFPTDLSLFDYNETIAQEHFPLTKEEALAQGYSWKDPEERSIKVDIHTEDLPDHIKDVKDDIIGKVIECQHKGQCNEQCTSAFKIIPQELEFYRKMNLSLPRFCPNCRHYQRFKQRNPFKLWHGKCQCNGNKSSNGIYSNNIEHFHKDKPCPNEFETSYAPDRPEIIYCEECYKREVE